MDLISHSTGTIVWMILIIIVLITWSFIIFNISRSDKLTNRGKLIFLILVLILPLIGSLLYLNLKDKERIYR
jgi:glucan phosphoethanolaminetransferase (alkaline phosphatase superfamily)